MYCSGGFAFEISLSWLELLARLRRIGAWSEWRSVDHGDVLLSLHTTDHWPRRFEKLAIYYETSSERWILDSHFDCEGADADDRWAVFAWRILETLTVLDAVRIEKRTSSSSLGLQAWRAFDHHLGFTSTRPSGPPQTPETSTAAPPTTS